MEENQENNVYKTITPDSDYSKLPVKTGFWNSFKSFWARPIVLELTPYEKKVFTEFRDFWNQEIVVEEGIVHLRNANSGSDENPEMKISL